MWIRFVFVLFHRHCVMATFGAPVRNMVAERGDDTSQQTGLASVIDTRLLGKPPVLSGAEEEYNDWAYIMKSYLSCIAQEYTEILGAVEALDEKGSLEQLLVSTYSTDHKRLSTSLHHILTMTTKGKALRVVQQADPGNGYLAWWRLRTEMVPQVRSRLLGVLQTLLSVRFESKDRLLVELNEWERNVILFEQQSGEEISGNIKRAVLQQSLPADLRQALQIKTNIDSYTDFRAALRDDVLARKA